MLSSLVARLNLCHSVSTMGGRSGISLFLFSSLKVAGRAGHKDISLLPVLRTLRQEDCLEVEASLDYMQKLCPDKPERGREGEKEKERGGGGDIIYLGVPTCL